MNEHSSRSHVLVMLTVTKRAARVSGSPTGGSLLARVGKLYLVDLAGSERLKKSMSTGAAASGLGASQGQSLGSEADVTTGGHDHSKQ